MTQPVAPDTLRVLADVGYRRLMSVESTRESRRANVMASQPRVLRAAV